MNTNANHIQKDKQKCECETYVVRSASSFNDDPAAGRLYTPADEDTTLGPPVLLGVVSLDNGEEYAAVAFVTQSCMMGV